MESLSCIVLNFLQRRSITDTFDQYVVLAFFLTAVITIIVSILLVKYVTYNIRLDKERLRNIAKRKVLPSKTEESDYDSDEADENIMWKEESSDEDANSPDSVDNLESKSIMSHLDTNYVESKNTFFEEETKGACTDDNSDLDTKWLGLWLHLKNPDFELRTPRSQSHALSAVFVSHQSEYSISSPQLYQQHLLQIFTIRKIGFIHLINFTVDVLLYERIISQDQALPLKAKYEQNFEKACFNSGVFDLSKVMVEIIRDFLKDLRELSVERKTIEEVLSLFLSQPLNCLKIYLLSVSDLVKSSADTSKVILYGISTVEKTLVLLKSRYVYLKNAIVNTNCPASFLSGFNNEIQLIFSEFQTEMQQTITSLCQRNLTNSTEQTLKLEQAINILKIDILNSSINSVKKLEAFGDGLMGVFIKHLESYTFSILDSNTLETKRVKERIEHLQKNTSLKIQACEERMLIQLQEQLNLKDSDVSKITSHAQKDIKELINTYNLLLNDCQNSLSEKQEKVANFMNLCIDYIIKCVSSRYRTVLAANIACVKSWPSLSEQTINKLEHSVRGKMSMVSFDLVLALVSHFLIEMEDKKHCFVEHIQSVPVGSYFADCFLEGNKSRPELIEQTVLKSLQDTVKPFAIPDEMLDCNTKEHYTIIMRAFNDLSTGLLKMLRREVSVSCRQVYAENLQVYTAAQAQLSSGKSNSQGKKNNNQRYLSRKGSSFKEKSVGDELDDLYKGLIEVKEHRYNEKIDELKLNVYKNGGKAKTPNNTCMRYLNMQTEFLQSSADEQKLPLISFENETYYMREMLLKKILKKGEEEREEKLEKEKEEVTSPTNRKSLKNSRKSTLGAIKRRKSRKVSDLV